MPAAAAHRPAVVTPAAAVEAAAGRARAVPFSAHIAASPTRIELDAIIGPCNVW